jgi:hypothetical protein
VVPAAPVRPKQEEFEFVKDCKGREWDYCALATNDEKMNASMISQLYRDRGDCENNFDEFKAVVQREAFRQSVSGALR